MRARRVLRVLRAPVRSGSGELTREPQLPHEFVRADLLLDVHARHKVTERRGGVPSGHIALAAKPPRLLALHGLVCDAGLEAQCLVACRAVFCQYYSY